MKAFGALASVCVAVAGLFLLVVMELEWRLFRRRIEDREWTDDEGHTWID